MAEACSRALGKDRELYLAGTSKEGWKSIKRKGWTGNWKGNSLVRVRKPNQGQAAASMLRLLRVEVFKALCCFLEIVCQSLTWEKLAPSPKKRCIWGTHSQTLFWGASCDSEIGVGMILLLQVVTGYSVWLPLKTSCVAAFMSTSLLCEGDIYKWHQGTEHGLAEDIWYEINLWLWHHYARQNEWLAYEFL